MLQESELNDNFHVIRTHSTLILRNLIRNFVQISPSNCMITESVYMLTF